MSPYYLKPHYPIAKHATAELGGAHGSLLMAASIAIRMSQALIESPLASAAERMASYSASLIRMRSSRLRALSPCCLAR